MCAAACARARAGGALPAAVARGGAWRAHAYGALSELRLDDTRVTALSAPDQLLVRLTSSSLNPLDVAMIGGYGRVALDTLRALDSAGGGGGALPLTVGRDLAGEVVRAGAAVGDGLRAGRRVWAVVPPHWDGAHRQLCVVRAAWCAPQPAALSGLQAGGALYTGLTACAALRAAGLSAGAAGARVLVLGAGGVGQAALQLLTAAGARVTLSAGSELHAWALEAGAEHTLDRHTPDYEQQLERGGPYAAIIDCAGLGGAAAAARRWRYRRYVTLTTPLLREMDARGVLAGAAAAALELARQTAAARRAGGGSVHWAYFSPRADDVALLGALAGRGRLSPRVQAVLPWRAAPAAYALMAAGHARGKIMLDFTDDSCSS